MYDKSDDIDMHCTLRWYGFLILQKIFFPMQRKTLLQTQKQKVRS